STCKVVCKVRPIHSPHSTAPDRQNCSATVPTVTKSCPNRWSWGTSGTRVLGDSSSSSAEPRLSSSTRNAASSASPGARFHMATRTFLIPQPAQLRGPWHLEQLRLRTRRPERGQSLVEFALVLPMLLVLLLGIADFGRVFAAGILLEA